MEPLKPYSCCVCVTVRMCRAVCPLFADRTTHSLAQVWKFRVVILWNFLPTDASLHVMSRRLVRVTQRRDTVAGLPCGYLCWIRFAVWLPVLDQPPGLIGCPCSTPPCPDDGSLPCPEKLSGHHTWCTRCASQDFTLFT